MKLRKSATRRRAKLRLEMLEDRITPSSSVIESFEPGSLAAYQAAIRNSPGYSLTGEILPIAAHDGSNGLVKQDDYDWLVRNDSGSQIHQGDTVSVWVKMAGVADGRAYLGFDAQNIGADHSPLPQSGALSVVMAANTNQLLIENNSSGSTSGNGIATFNTVAAVSQTYQADHWYRLEAMWGAGGAITGRLYDSDGVTLLSTVNGTTTPRFPNGAGIAFRAFGHDKYFDTVVLDTGSTDTPAQRVAVDPGLASGWTPGNPPPPVTNGPSGGPAPVPWAYTSFPGTGIEVQLAAFNQLTQVPSGGIVNGVVGLAAMNLSAITGTSQVGWGDPLETPLLAQYIFRELPGQPTQLIGASSVKHFFSSAHADFQHLNPGESDTYVSSLNMTQDLYTDGSELDPVTGTLHSPIDRGTLSVDGMVNNVTRTFSNHIQELLQVNVADLDPAQNPAGTRWFLAGNLFVDGEQDVTQASRWVEIVPAFNGTTFTFTYPNGSGGQLNFRTIPGLVDTGLTVTNVTTGTVSAQPFSSITVTFDRAIRPNTFTTDQISLTGPNGAISLANATITPVGSLNTQFTVTFSQQSTQGAYTLTIGPNILDSAGNPMHQAFETQIFIEGPRIIASTPSGTNNLPNTVNHVRLTFNEPIDLTTLIDAVSVVGPSGAINVNSVTAVAGSNTQFDINFDTLTQSGPYEVTIAPSVADPFGNPLDQDQDAVGGQADDSFVADFGISGPQVVGNAVANSTVAGGVYSLRVAFNEDMNLASFTTSSIASFTDSNGNDILGSVFAVVQDPTAHNFRTFDVLFVPQTAAGTYTMVIGPGIQDAFGNAMDQDADATLTAGGDDQFTATFNVNGPLVVLSSPTGNQNPGVDHVQVNFNSAIDPASLTADHVSFTGPAGALSVTDIEPVPYTNNTQFVITFDSQVAAGNYALTLSTGITDAYGNPLSAPFTDRFTITAPAVTSASPTGSLVGPVDHVHLTFSRAIDTTTFTTDQVAFIDPHGAPIGITSVTETAGTNHTQFDINFAPQGIAGNFTLTLGSGITDLFGNPLAAQLPSELVVNGGFENPLGSEWTIVDPTGSTYRTSTDVPVHSGSFALALGRAGADATITQTVPTVPGETYTFSFWYWSSGQGPNDFHALWNGTEVYSEVNPPAHGYQLHTFTEMATGSTTTIQFLARNDPVFDALDDVSVIATSAISFVERFTITSPTVTGTTPGAGTVAAPFSHVVVTFDRPMDATTLTGAVTLNGPGGAIPVTITAVAGQGNRQFDVSFDAQSAPGNYTLAISTAAHDTFANPLASAFSRVFTIQGASSNLVTNGGFETGDFTGWTQSGNTSFTAVSTTFDGTGPHSGTYAAHFGPNTGLGFISQALATTAGASYTLTFWLAHPYADSGTEWLVQAGGNTLMDVHDAGNFGYTQFTFTFTATSTSTVLRFGFLEPPNYFFLDDVSVTRNP
jgi:hypothetical protein